MKPSYGRKVLLGLLTVGLVPALPLTLTLAASRPERAVWAAVFALLSAGILACVFSKRWTHSIRNLVRQALELRRSKLTNQSGDLNELELLAQTLQQAGEKMKDQKIALRTQAKKMKQSTEKYRALVENVRAIIFTLEKDGCLAFANAKWEETLGYDSGHVTGREFGSLIHPEDRQEWEEAFHQSMEKGEAVHEQVYRIADHDGAWRWLSAKGTPVIDPDGGAPFFMGIAEDVTEKHRMERHLLQAQKMESIGALAGGIAHDIGNLLTPMLGYSQLIRDHIANEELMLEFIDVLEVNLSKLDQLTRQLLLFGRKSDVQFYPMELGPAIQEALSLLSHSVGSGFQISVDLSEEHHVLRGDPTQIQQVLMNLCLNATDAMPDGGSLSIESATVEPDERFLQSHPGSKPTHYVRLSVTDGGIGMSHETQAKVFEPFYTTKEKGKGTGLGLAMVLKIIEDHRGFIDIESEPGQGSTFSVFLPLMESEAQQPVATESEST